MSLNNLFNQLIDSASSSVQKTSGESQGLSGLTSKIPGGLAGGAAAGGLVALLMGSKSARKFAGKAATYGGAAVLGGLAFKAFQNWKQQPPTEQNSITGQQSSMAENEQDFHHLALNSTQQGLPFELTLIRSMIAAARADGHIDNEEQRRIFAAVKRMDLSAEHKGLIFDWLQQDIAVQQLADEAQSIELKAEIYLASCLVIDLDHDAERDHLQSLAKALRLDDALCRELENQAQQAYAEAA